MDISQKNVKANEDILSLNKAKVRAIARELEGKNKILQAQLKVK